MQNDVESTGLGAACDPEVKRQVLNRLHRAYGQLKSIIEAVEGDGDCRAVITQLAAVSSAVRRAGYVIVANHMERSLGPCGDNTGDAANEMSVEELEKLFMMLG